MAFKPKNLEYLQTISRLKGRSITNYVNQVTQENTIDNNSSLIEMHTKSINTDKTTGYINNTESICIENAEPESSENNNIENQNLINILKPENVKFLKAINQLKDCTVSKYINGLVDSDRERVKLLLNGNN